MTGATGRGIADTLATCFQTAKLRQISAPGQPVSPFTGIRTTRATPDYRLYSKQTMRSGGMPMALTPRAAQCYDRLVAAARQEQRPAYSEVAGWLTPPLDMGNPAHRNELSQLLGDIGTFEHAQGRPLLPAIVVYQQGGMPGPGFYELAQRLGLYGGSKDELAQLGFFVEEAKRVYAHWKRR